MLYSVVAAQAANPFAQAIYSWKARDIMPIDIQSISATQRELVLHTGEGHFSDVKAVEIKPAKLTESIAAFANSDGGELYVGIDEVGVTKERRWRGFQDIEAANGHL